MHILITGGAGFLGRKLATALLARGGVTRLTLVDIVAAPATGDARVHSLAGDLGEPALLDQAFDGGVDGVYHLAAVVSGEA